MLSAPGESGPAYANAAFIQDLAAKGLETVRLTEALSIAPEDEATREALAQHLSSLRDSAADLGFEHLERAVGGALTRLEQESFGPPALLAVRVLAWRYESLTAMSNQSGTHRAVEPATRLEVLLGGDQEASGDLEEFGVSALLRATRRLRPRASIALQDSASLFELEVRDGHIAKVTRTGIDAEVTRGAAALPALVQMSSGRFVVAEAFATTEPLPVRAPSRELIGAEIQQDSWPVADPVERENVRAQVAVSMHREPANRAPVWAYPIWRLNVSAQTGRSESGSGFGMEMQTIPRVLGFAFLTLLSATVGFLVWGQLTPRGAPTAIPAAVHNAPEDVASVAEPARAAMPAARASRPAYAEFSGSLRAGVDPSIEITGPQGVLELIGPSGVRVDVDGVDRGALPMRLALDQGRHEVRYRMGDASTYRFYYVKSGATCALTVLTQAGGLVDAR